MRLPLGIGSDMSYSQSFTFVDGMTDIDWDEFDHSPLDNETKDVLSYAIESAESIIGGDILGDHLNYEFRVVISGHHNPGAEPREGWSNDSLTINIYQVKERE